MTISWKMSKKNPFIKKEYIYVDVEINI